MSSVFFGGSRKLSRLNSQIRQRILGLTQKQFTVLIGDANGADKAVQSFLAEEGYRNVEVYCMEGECRNNIGNWPTVSVHHHQDKKDFSFYVQKDAEMSRKASYGFMLWDGKSKGTLNNILNLVQQGKMALVYFSPDREFVTVKGKTDVEQLVARCDADSKQIFERTLKLTDRASSHQGTLQLA